MRQKDLRTYVLNMDPFLPRCRSLELAIGVGVGLGNALYGSQKQHWLEWLDDYAMRATLGGDTYNVRSAGFIYNRIMCPPMLYWLAEGARVPDFILDDAYHAVVAAPPRPGSRCAALRRALPWRSVEFSLSSPKST